MGRSFLEGRSYVRGRAPNLNRLSRARQDLALSPIQCSRNSQSCVCSIGETQTRRVDNIYESYTSGYFNNAEHRNQDLKNLIKSEIKIESLY